MILTTSPRGAALLCPAVGDLHTELTALEVEREPLLAAVIRAELLAEQAAAQLEQTRQLWDRQVGEAKEASRQAEAARRALRRHDAAIAEVQAEIAAATELA